MDKRFNFNGIPTELNEMSIVIEANGSYLNVIDYRVDIIDE